MVQAVFWVALATAVMVWLSNPARFTNQVFACAAALIATHAFLVHKAIGAGAQFAVDGVTSPVVWLRANGSVAALMPAVLWLLHMIIAERVNAPTRSVVRRWLPFLVIAGCIAVVPWTEWYIPSDSRPDNELRGPGYLAMVVIVLAFQILLIAKSWMAARRASGIQRIEMQFLALNFSVSVFTVIVLNALGNYLKMPVLKHVGLVANLLVLVIAAWAICRYRIFHLQQVGVLLARRGIPLVLLALTGWICHRVFARGALSHPVVFVTVAVGAGALGLAFDYLTAHWFASFEATRVSRMRKSAAEAAASEADVGRLVSRFEAILSAEFPDAQATLMVDSGDAYLARGYCVRRNSELFKVLLELGWATPESLQRRRMNSGNRLVNDFMKEGNLGLVIASMRSRLSPSIVVVLTCRSTGQPFTYPEICRIESVLELMENMLMHARLAAQAALRARAEQLAMMSRGLAHDLKNLLTPVSSFLMHLDTHYPPGSAEAEAHGAARRSVRVMTDYVREALFFSARLEPRFEPVNVGNLIATALAVAAPRAQARRVTLASGPNEEILIEADRVLLERLLANLVGNAIDASKPDSEVAVIASTPERGRVRLEVVDWGCGIEAGSLEKIFEPYYTTKVFGEDVRGFGLGLTISRKIVDLHGGKIRATSTLGRGTTITVDLPVVQPRTVRAARAA